MAGILATTFFILPALGMTKTSIVLALLNFMGAAGVFLVSTFPKEELRVKGAEETIEIDAGRLCVTLFTTGFLGIGFEVIMMRVLSQILENTVFSFASLLSVYLLGTAVGAALYQKYVKQVSFEKTLFYLLNCIALFCLASILLLPYVSQIYPFLYQGFGGGFWGSVLGEIELSLLVFLLPTAAMGATFSHLAQGLRGSHGGVGKALCLNTLGGSLAPVFFGLWLIPVLGIKRGLLFIAAGYLLLIPRFRFAYLPVMIFPAAILLFISVNPNQYHLVTTAEGDSIVAHHEGVMASVTVLKDSQGEYHLKVNNHFQMGGTSSTYSDRRQAHLPLLLHPDPTTALFLGLGTGTTFAAAAHYPGLQADGVELIPEIIKVLPFFEKATGDFSQHNNLHIKIADARRYVQSCRKKYDVIIADLFHPARDGAGALYTVEHFYAVRKLLTDDGLFFQWIPLYQLDLGMLRVITRTFLEVFPDAQMFLAHYSLQSPIIGLMGGRNKLRYPADWYRGRLKEGALAGVVHSIRFDSLFSLLGTFVAGSTELNKFAGGSPLNTDKNPVVLFQAPHFVYGSPSSPQERIITLINILSPPDVDKILIDKDIDIQVKNRLEAYWLARDSFLKAGINVNPTSNPRKLFKTVSTPLLSVVRQSSDFSTAYNPLLAIAYSLYSVDRESAHQLLLDLEDANPLRSEARTLRSRLFRE
jgi:spermidine synthase